MLSARTFRSRILFGPTAPKPKRRRHEAVKKLDFGKEDQTALPEQLQGREVPPLLPGPAPEPQHTRFAGGGMASREAGVRNLRVAFRIERLAGLKTFISAFQILKPVGWGAAKLPWGLHQALRSRTQPTSSNDLPSVT